MAKPVGDTNARRPAAAAAAAATAAAGPSLDLLEQASREVANSVQMDVFRQQGQAR